MRGTALPFYHSLNKKPLVFGCCNKEYFNLLATICFALVYSGRLVNIYSDVFALVIFIVGFYFGCKISAADPQIMEVYRRHLHTKDYYPPISGIHAPVKFLKPSVEFYKGKKNVINLNIS